MSYCVIIRFTPESLDFITTGDNDEMAVWKTEQEAEAEMLCHPLIVQKRMVVFDIDAMGTVK